MSRTSRPAELRPRVTLGDVRPRRRPGALRRWLWRLLKFALLTVLVGTGALVGLFWYHGRDLPSVDRLRHYRPPQTTRVLDRHGRPIGEIFTERRTVVPMERIPRIMVLCVLAAEDADFYNHEGLDYPGILRALLIDAPRGRITGASTITQQVVKLLLLSPERTLSRKLRELILARRLEQELTKDQILHLYLNHVNFGHGRHGVQEAARFYFGKDVEQLTLAEASMLAGIPQAPARLSPRTHPEAARRRQRYVLDQLAQRREEYWPDVPPSAIEEARRNPPALVPLESREETAPELMAIVRELLRERLGEQALRDGGYVVHTTIDLDLQRLARRTLREGLEQIDARNGYRGPLRRPRGKRPAPPPPQQARLSTGRTYEATVSGTDDDAGLIGLDVGGHRAFVSLAELGRYNPEGLPASRFAEIGARVRVSIERLADPDEGASASAQARLELGPQGALVAIDPRTRHVLALVGGYEAEPGFDRATQALRQPGSAFKPIVYAAALRARRITPASLLLDAPAVYDRWRPDNYEPWRHEGPVRVRHALAHSLNVVAVRLLEDLGPPAAVELAQALGLSGPFEPSLALALGASEVRPIELVNAYASFAAGGRWEPWRLVVRIDGPDGTRIALPAEPPAREPLTAAEAYLVTSLLRSVVTEGTAREAETLRRPVAGKTGTSNEARDAWFVGYSTDVVAGVWIGFDDRRPLGRRESGARSALPIWIAWMQGAHNGRPVTDFPVPAGIQVARVDPSSGLLAPVGAPGSIEEVFLEGTAPTATSTRPDVTDAAAFLAEQMGAAASPP
ncbi:MAG: PBP1A family penicillin-binding protein [Myxococcota bacterium]|nr:PBP1A family penicillin-binding protein [Myxococcota bacterium]MDW8361023.1 PBP1A family penicillin-binding protein [Myxococcales bacterium]